MSQAALKNTAKTSHSGFVQLDKEILKWPPQMRLIWLTLKSWEAYGVYEKEFAGNVIQLVPGELATTVRALAKASGVTIQECRTVLGKLKKLGLITCRAIWQGRKVTGTVICIQSATRSSTRSPTRSAAQSNTMNSEPNQDVTTDLAEPQHASPHAHQHAQPHRLEDRIEKKGEDNLRAGARASLSLAKKIGERVFIGGSKFVPIASIHRTMEAALEQHGIDAILAFEKDLEQKGELGGYWSFDPNKVPRAIGKYKGTPAAEAEPESVFF